MSIFDEQAAKDVIEYVLDDREYQDYIDNCLENGFDPYDLKTSNHVYAKGLRALGWKLEMAESDRDRFKRAGIKLSE